MAALRLTAAAGVFGAAIWLVVESPAPRFQVIAGLSMIAVLAWLAMALRARRRLATPERHRLVLAPEGLRLVEGERERQIPWSDVESIEIEDERLVVQVRVRGAEPLLVEPRYGGLGAHALESALRQARGAALGESSQPAKPEQ